MMVIKKHYRDDHGQIGHKEIREAYCEIILNSIFFFWEQSYFSKREGKGRHFLVLFLVGNTQVSEIWTHHWQSLHIHTIRHNDGLKR